MYQRDKKYNLYLDQMLYFLYECPLGKSSCASSFKQLLPINALVIFAINCDVLPEKCRLLMFRVV